MRDHIEPLFSPENLVPAEGGSTTLEGPGHESSLHNCSGDAVAAEDLLYFKNVKGGFWTAVAHIITAVIGAGVLSLAWSISQLGWIAGPLVMFCFAGVTAYSSNMLTNCFRYPDPVNGPHRNRSYEEAVAHYLGNKHALMCAIVQYVSFYGTAIAYTITTAQSIRAVLESYCYHKNGHDVQCEYSDLKIMAVFGVLQIFFSQIRDFNKISGLSFLAAVMSILYACIGLFLVLSKVIEHGEFRGNLGGIVAETGVSASFKTFKIFQALGDIAYAFPYTCLVIEIESTLLPPPPEVHTMKKASLFSASIITIFNVLCGCFGYAAFGKHTPGQLLTGFGKFEPYWLVCLANFCVAVHLIGAYQVYLQPVFAFGEKWASETWPNNEFVAGKWKIGLPHRVNLLRLTWRPAIVISVTIFAVLFPSFNYILGILGALNFWPLTIYLPVRMHMIRKKYQNWSQRGILLHVYSVICLLVSLVTAVGSLEGIIKGDYLAYMIVLPKILFISQ